MSRFKRGLLIAFEGLDRSGKTTQAQLLKSFYESQQKPVHLMRFPVRSTEIGKKIDEHLKSKREYTHEQIHELFSHNRWEMRDEMLTRIQNGTNIILDRYAYSGVAYSVAKGLGLNWCKKHDKGLPKPDFVFYLDLSVEEAMTREGFGLELFERKDFQNKVRDSYRQLFGDEWIIVPANKSAEEVHKEIVLNLEKHSKTLLSASQTIQQLWLDA